MRVIIPGKMHKFALNIAQKRLAAGLRPDPLENLQRSPDTLAGLRGREVRGRAGNGQGKKEGERKGNECEVRVKGGRGKEDAIPSF